MASTSPLTIEEWLRLPELPISEDGIEHFVLKVGVLWARRADAPVGGIENHWPPLESDSEEQLVMGTATLDTPSGPQMFRITHFLADWALEMVALAHNGIRIFPQRVWLRADADGIDIELLDDFQSPASGDVTVYVDESGNSGDVATGCVSGFGGQRVFTLVGVADDGCTGLLCDILSNLRTKHRLQAAEIKDKRQMTRHREFVGDLVRHVAANNSLFVEIMDKKFYLATSLVTFCLASSRFNLRSDTKLANEFADIVTDIVDDAALFAYGEFAKIADRQSFDVFETEFRRALLRAKLLMNAQQEREFQLVEDLEAAFSTAVEQRASSDYLSFLPNPDLGPTGKRIAMLPHVPAFCNLWARVNRYARCLSSVRVVHDQQAQFDVVLRQSASLIESNGHAFERMLRGTRAKRYADFHFRPGKFELNFADSRLEPGIQVADIIARLCTHRMNAVLAGEGSTTEFEDAFEMLHDLGRPSRGVGVNVVATRKMAARFWAPGRGDV